MIASTCREAQRVIEDLLRRLHEAQWHQDDIFAVHIALEEALSNAIRHGNRNNPAKKVTVDYRLGEDGIEIRVADEGEGFDPDKVPDPTLPENMNSTSGRGLCLMRGFMDQVLFSEGGRVVWMSRRRRHLPSTIAPSVGDAAS